MGTVTAGADRDAGAAVVAAGVPVAAAEGVVVACGAAAVGSPVGLVAVDNVPQAMPTHNSTTASNQKCLMLPPTILIHESQLQRSLRQFPNVEPHAGRPESFLNAT